MKKDDSNGPTKAIKMIDTSNNISLWGPFERYRNVRDCSALAVALGVKSKPSLTPSMSSHPLIMLLTKLQLPALGTILTFLGGDSLPDKVFALLSVTGDHGCARVGGQDVDVQEQSYATAKEAAANAASFIVNEESSFEFDERENPTPGTLLQESHYSRRCYLLQLCLDKIKESSDNLSDQVYCLSDIYTDEGQSGNPETSWDRSVYMSVETAAIGARELWGQEEDLEERMANDPEFSDYTSNSIVLDRVKKDGNGIVLASECRGIRIHRLVLPRHDRYIRLIDNAFEESIRKVAKKKRTFSSYVTVDEKALSILSNFVVTNCRGIIDAAASKLSFGEESEKAIILEVEFIRDAVSTRFGDSELGKIALSSGDEAIANFSSSGTSSTSTALTDSDDSSISKLLEIDFSVLQVEHYVTARISKNSNNAACSREGAVYLAAVLDYLTVEVVECSKRYARDIDYRTRKVLVRHVAMAIKSDKELCNVYDKAV